ncbi:MAG: LysM peptidoglycan-binding domain-containing protein [Lachnospiraceae bacterium]
MMKRKWIGILVITFIAFCIFKGGTMIADAYANKEDAKQKYYESICIKDGDTLWSIADQYISEEYGNKDQYIRELMQINGLKTDCIQSGNYLTVTYYK